MVAAERIQAFTNTLANAVSTAGILVSSEAARYWAYHLSCSGFFMLQGLAGLLASRNAVGRGGGDSPAVNRFEAVFRQARHVTCSGGVGRQAVQHMQRRRLAQQHMQWRRQAECCSALLQAWLGGPCDRGASDVLPRPRAREGG